MQLSASFRPSVGWAIFLLLPLWCVGLFLRGYWTPDEPREADIIWRMTQQADQSVPQLAAERFMEKPPLSYWLGAVAQKLVGSSPAATRVPNLLYVVLACLAVGWLAQGMAGSRAGFFAALLFGSMFEVYRVGIWLAPDALLLTGCALSLLGAYRGYVAEAAVDKLRWYTLMHVGAVIGFMTKSAPGWLVPALALLGLIVIERRWRELMHWALWAGLLLQIAVVGAWLYAVWQRSDGAEVLKVMFWNNLAGRFTDIHAGGALNYASGHLNYPGKYLLESPYYLFPWFFCVIAALVKAVGVAWSRSRDEAVRPWRFALCASLPFMVLLSFSTTARDVYFAPVCIGLCLLVALWLASLPEVGESRLTRVMLRMTWVLTLIVAVLIALVLLVVAHELVAGGLALVIGACLLLAGVAFLALRYRLTSEPAAAEQSVLHNFAMHAATMLVAASCLNPLIDRIQSLPTLAAQIHHDTRDTQLALLDADETTIAMLDYQTARPITLLRAAADRPLDQPRKWLQGQPTHRLVLLLPGRARGPLGRLIKDKPEDHDDGLAGQLQTAGVARIVKRYELPHGRRYAVLADIS